jgi:hypothetical protein
MPAMAPLDILDFLDEDDLALALPDVPSALEFESPDEDESLFAPFVSLGELDGVGDDAALTSATQLFFVSNATSFEGEDLVWAGAMVNCDLSWLTVRTAEEKNMPPRRGIMPSPAAMRTIGICRTLDLASIRPLVAM